MGKLILASRGENRDEQFIFTAVVGPSCWPFAKKSYRKTGHLNGKN